MHTHTRIITPNTVFIRVPVESISGDIESHPRVRSSSYNPDTNEYEIGPRQEGKALYMTETEYKETTFSEKFHTVIRKISREVSRTQDKGHIFFRKLA